MKIGDKVKIIDGSEAHGDIGVIWSLSSLDDGFILVELNEDALWPVSEHEIRPIDKEES